MKSEEYIKWVNEQVRKGNFNRRIKVIYTKNKPTIEGKQGVASQVNYKNYDKISIWKGLAKDKVEAEKKSKRLGRKVITREQALRHEIWHVIEPYASEKRVRRTLENKKLPKRLPLRRRY